ncbi:hypothetical protein GALL_375130 [mine drainage metagenome]|uniref:Lipoprotein n=1 Tax=mine drainage metagenome TaxID=410659 RepID=A0A1J5QTB9_9ZZZZ
MKRLPVLALAMMMGSVLLAGCSQQTRAVNDPKCVAFRKAASVYTDRVTKTRYARRVAENAALGKAGTSPEVAEVKKATDVWLKAKSDLEHFYANDQSGCVSH